MFNKVVLDSIIPLYVILRCFAGSDVSSLFSASFLISFLERIFVFEARKFEHLLSKCLGFTAVEAISSLLSSYLPRAMAFLNCFPKCIMLYFTVSLSFTIVFRPSSILLVNLVTSDFAFFKSFLSVILFLNGFSVLFKLFQNFSLLCTWC